MLPGISTEQLRSRLNRMVADGLLTRQRYREVPPRVDYELTERSRDLMPVLGALAQWGYDWTWTAPRRARTSTSARSSASPPACSQPAAGLEGAVELVVDAEGDTRAALPVTMADGRVEIAERDREGTPTATVRGSTAAWVARSAPTATSRSSSSTATAPRRQPAHRLRRRGRAPQRAGRLSAGYFLPADE